MSIGQGESDVLGLAKENAREHSAVAHEEWPPWSAMGGGGRERDGGVWKIYGSLRQVADDRKSMNRSHRQVTFKRHSWLQKYAKLDFKLSLSQFFANGKSPGGTGEIAGSDSSVSSTLVQLGFFTKRPINIFIENTVKSPKVNRLPSSKLAFDFFVFPSLAVLSCFLAPVTHVEDTAVADTHLPARVHWSSSQFDHTTEAKFTPQENDLLRWAHPRFVQESRWISAEILPVRFGGGSSFHHHHPSLCAFSERYLGEGELRTISRGNSDMGLGLAIGHPRPITLIADRAEDADKGGTTQEITGPAALGISWKTT
ncbi:hypothetical protein B0H14DRAFT_2591776 [Mycena olivaceomarginata]|nr:hypothetical protein B0H14DRAFT_2591776 [Mycena olivaceomarginata]